MLIDLTQKTAIVCGGSHGIGKATAILLAEAGCSVIILGRNQEALQKTLKELDKSKSQIHRLFRVDLVELDQTLKIIQDINKQTSVDILINNVGGPPPVNVSECTTDEFLDVFSKQFLSFHILAQNTLPGMKNNMFGRIINVLGTSIKEPIPGFGLSTVKAATANWAKALSKEVGKYNITVNNILPGPTNTRELEGLLQFFAEQEGIEKEEYLLKTTANISLRRIAQPEEIGNVIVFLASQFASYITGSNIRVDGGFLNSI